MKTKASEFSPNSYPLENGNRLLEASAGTGKTFSLAHIVLRMLTEKEYPISSILVVSFTKNTAAEIKAKISNRIILALQGLELSLGKGNKPEDLDAPLINWLSKCSQNKSKRMRWANLLLDALANLDTADITTIHGFCKRTLEREAIESGNILEPQPLDEEENKDLILEIVHEYWREHILTIDPQHIKGIEQAGINTKSIADSLLEIDQDPTLEFNSHMKYLDITKELSMQFHYKLLDCWESFTYHWKQDGLSLESSLRELAKSYRENGIDDTKPFSPKPRKDRHLELNQWVDTFQEKKGNLNGVKQISYGSIRAQKLLKDYFHPQKINELERKNQISTSPLIKPSLQKAIASLWDEPAELVWNHALCLTLKRLKSIRLQRGVVSFSDQLRALNPDSEDSRSYFSSSLINKLRQRYRVALIDEFQDTDQIQWKIFKRLFGDSQKHLLLMVGDPKQAIYKFRGGDLKTYLQARKEVDRIDSLLTNFRSTPDLMNNLNKLFIAGLKHSRLEIPHLNTEQKIESKSSNKKNNALEIISLEYELKQNLSSNKNLPSKNDVETVIPIVVTNKVLELITSEFEEIDPNDICILVNRHLQAEQIRASLTKSNIPSRLVNKGDIFKSQAARELQKLLDCLANPTHIEKVKLVASSPLMQWDAERLKNAENNGEINDLIIKFTNWSNNLESIGIIGCLSNILGGKNIADLSKRGRLLEDLYQCAHLIQEAAHSNGLDARSSSKWFRQQRFHKQASTPHNRQPNSDLEDQAINVITIHRSKGLQYKVVICPYLWQSPPLPKGPLWRSDKDQKWLLALNLGWRDEKEIAEKTIKESIQEAERLAYVALTRAQEKLIVIWSPIPKQDNNPLKHFLFGPKAIDFELKDLSAKQINDWFQENELDAKIKKLGVETIKGKWQQPLEFNSLELGPIPKRTLDKTWGRHSYSSWISTTYEKHDESIEIREFEDGRDTEQQEAALRGSQTEVGSKSNSQTRQKTVLSKEGALQNFPRGPQAGDCLHRIIEKIDFTISINNIKISEIIKEELQRSGIDIANLKSVKEGINRLLRTRLGGPLNGLRFNQLDTNHRINELGFDLSMSRGGKPVKSSDIAKALSNIENNNYKDLNISSTGFLTGSIDLVFKDITKTGEGKWWIADWKSNWLGTTHDSEGTSLCGPYHYSSTAMDKEMTLHHYHLQANLYLVALHRFLNWRLKDYSPSRHLGGYVYVFLRGLPSESENSESKESPSEPGLVIKEASIKSVYELDKLFKDGGK